MRRTVLLRHGLGALGSIGIAAAMALPALQSPTWGATGAANVPVRPPAPRTDTFTAKRQAKAAARLRSQGR